jgi:hypothetical protein
VLVGHSLGADAVMFMAEYLGKKGVPVALVVPFDGTGSFAASSNVGQVYNLTQRDYAYMRKGAGFRGTLNNVDVSGQGYGHIDIDKSARLHALVLARIQSVIRSRGVPQTDEATAAPRPRAAAPATDSAPAAVQPAPAAKPAADAAPATAAPATTASTNASASASASVSVERTPAAAPAVSRPASVSTGSSAKRQPASESGAKPALRF